VLLLLLLVLVYGQQLVGKVPQKDAQQLSVLVLVVLEV
jgi:hypothetical protein